MDWIDYLMYALVIGTALFIFACVGLELAAMRQREREMRRYEREGYSLELLEASIEGDISYDDAQSEYLNAAWEAAVRDHGLANAQWARINHGRVGGLRVLNKHTQINRG